MRFVDKVQRNLNWNGVKKIVRYPFNLFAEKYRDIEACFYLKKMSKKQGVPGKRIKVGFIVQIPECWDKEILVYEKMIEHSDFEPFLIVVPAYRLGQEKFSDYGEELEYFSGFAIENNLILGIEKGKVRDLSQDGFDYIFYQRPYDTYMPEGIKSHNLVKFTKVCYVPYAFWGYKVDLCGYNREFYRNLYWGFMESEENALAIQKKVISKYNHISFKGYPVIESCEFKMPDTFNNILWTPRWTYSETNEGSHFFEYKEAFVNLSREDAKMKLVFRPHPLAFENYILQGYMTRQEVERYLNRLNEHGIIYDQNKMINETFKNTDILITDLSSIILMFMLSGKPIILCELPTGVTNDYEMLLEGMYIAQSWEDVKKYINDIRKGNDYLYNKRKDIANKILVDNKNASFRILETVRTDYMGLEG